MCGQTPFVRTLKEGEGGGAIKKKCPFEQVVRIKRVSVKQGLTVWSNPVCTDIEGGGGGIKKKVSVLTGCPYEAGVRKAVFNRIVKPRLYGH